jgi:hydroxymethylpyrimidine/phosphomethylpyrimidine kinase
MRTVLTIGGSDSSGGTGIQADLKAFSANGVVGMSVVTVVTAQNTRGVSAVQDIDADMIAKQIASIFDDIEVDAVKIGMVSGSEAIRIIAYSLKQYGACNIVVDPVMVSQSGYQLLNPDAIAALTACLLPMSTVVAANIPEAQELAGMIIINLKDLEEAARRIHCLGPRYVLLKGEQRENDVTGILFDGQTCQYLSGQRLPPKHTQRAGATLSAAITANLASGYPVYEAVYRAKEYITTAFEHSWGIGKGVSPIHHFHTLYQKAGVFTNE